MGTKAVFETEPSPPLASLHSSLSIWSEAGGLISELKETHRPRSTRRSSEASPRTLLVWFCMILQVSATASAQSGVHRARFGSADFGANFTINVFQFDGARSTAVDDVVRLSESF